MGSIDLDSQFAILRQIIVEELARGVECRELAELLVSRDEIFHQPPFLKSSRFAGMTPIQAAVSLILAEMSKPLDDDRYGEFRDFFISLLRGARKDIISGEFLIMKDGIWQPVENDLDAIKSYAYGAGHKYSQTLMHLRRFIDAQPKRLLVDLPKWDGADRIDQLKKYVKVKNQSPETFVDAIKEWGANIFRRLYQNGAQNRCIILKGGQGLGKDHLLNSLFKSFGPYYGKFSSNRDERECWSQVTSRLVLHIEEFDQTGNLSIPFLKDLITRDLVTYRSPYDRRAITKKCVGSFISTVNIDAVLRDETGNRRFAVFEIESIDWSYPKDWSDQIAAQFYELYSNDFWASDETWSLVTQGNEQFEQVDINRELLDLWDERVTQLMAHSLPPVHSCTYEKVAHVIKEMVQVSGLKMRQICTMLKTSGRSIKIGGKMRYYAASQKTSKDRPIEQDRPACVLHLNIDKDLGF